MALATRRGWRVTALARKTDTAFLHRAGADRAVDGLKGLARRFDAVLDTARLDEVAMQAVSDGGRYLGLVPFAVPMSVRGIQVDALQARQDGKRLGELLALAAKGALETRIAGLLPLADAAKAHRCFERGGQRGRWVLVA